MRTLHENCVHGTPVFPLEVYTNHDEDGFFFAPQHWHEELEWLYVDNGLLELIIHGKEYTLSGGEFCFINAEELHEIKSVGESLHHAILFKPELLDFAVYDACQHGFIRPVTSQRVLFPTACSCLPDDAAGKVLALMKEVAGLYKRSGTGAALGIKIKLLQVVEVLFEAGCFLENTCTQTERESLSNLKLAIDYIHRNYGGPISLQALADMSFMSPNYFCHKFKRELGKPPIKFINEYRIQQASKLLAESGLSVSEISESVGFDNLSYFIRKFKEYKGVTPAKYRQMV